MMYLGNQAVGIATSLPIFSENMMIECGEYISENDVPLSDNIIINHNLGTIPDFFIVQTVDVEITNTHPKKYLISCLYTKINSTICSLYTRSIKAQSTDYATFNGTTSISSASIFANESNIKFFAVGTDGYIKANTKYYYTIGKFKEVTSNAN